MGLRGLFRIDPKKSFAEQVFNKTQEKTTTIDVTKDGFKNPLLRSLAEIVPLTQQVYPASDGNPARFVIRIKTGAGVFITDDSDLKAGRFLGRQTVGSGTTEEGIVADLLKKEPATLAVFKKQGGTSNAIIYKIVHGLYQKTEGNKPDSTPAPGR